MSSPGYSTTTTPGETDRLHLSHVISLHVCPRFVYTYTDGRGWPTYQYINSQSEVIYLHFYDEGLFYDGFYVINDLEVKERGGGQEMDKLIIALVRLSTRRWMVVCSSTTLIVTTVLTRQAGTGKNIQNSAVHHN